MIVAWTGSLSAAAACSVFDPSLVPDSPDDDDGGGAMCESTDELCNGLDDDCDDEVDEDFDLAGDADNCGACGRACSFGNATGQCAEGVCVNACESGFQDCNLDDADGCEADLASRTTCGGCDLTCPFACSGADCVTGATVSAGRTWTCLGLSSGGARCWGSNATGQLGTGDTLATPVPRDVASLSDALQLRTGFGHSCALRGGRVASCWGQNDRGQVGDGTTAPRTAPVPVVLGGVDDIAVGFAHTCARSGARLHCWGFNDAGQLGLGDMNHRPLPTLVPVKDTGDVAGVAIGLSHTCAVRTSGEVICFGYNDQGQTGRPSLGQGGTNQVLAPEVVPAIADAVQVSLGHAHSCALTSGGGVRCWGWNGSGQLGNGGFMSSPDPVDVIDDTGVPLVGVDRVIAGATRTCALAGDQVYCWGDNTDGALGADEGSPSHPRALRVTAGAEAILDVAVGEFHTCFLGALGVRCVGTNQMGQLGDGTTAASRTGVDVRL